MGKLASALFLAAICGGIGEYDDAEENAAYVNAVLKAADMLQLGYTYSVDTSDSNYHECEWRGDGWALRAIDCVAGGHGYRNATLLFEEEL